MDTAMIGAPVTWVHRSRPLIGEVESGDLHVVAPFAGGTLIGVVDGLGHGSDAATASRLAVAAFSSDPSREPVELMHRAHEALRKSRGAAALLISLSFDRQTFSWVGVGNIEGLRIRDMPLSKTSREALISAPGVVGYQLPPLLRSRHGPLAPGDLFALASDGIAPGFSEMLSARADLDELASGVLDSHARANDDALLLIARYQGVTG
jgi:phosphoserine phosphatase RsbX